MKSEQRYSALVKILASGAFVSGEDLARRLAVTRTTIRKDIEYLKTLGLAIFSVKGRGYKAAYPFQALCSNAISSNLHSKDIAPITTKCVVSSTNDVFKAALHKLQNGEVLLAEVQTNGRGRRGKQWLAPLGSCLMFSIHWKFDYGLENLSGLSIIVGIAICRVLRSLGINHAGLKWPNDLYVQQSKVGGVLVELEGEVGGYTHCVIGVGLNVHIQDEAIISDHPSGHPSGQPVTDLARFSAKAVDKNYLAALLIESLWQSLNNFEPNKFVSSLSEWNEYDIFRGKKVVLHRGTETVHGVAEGLDNRGGLQLRTEQGLEVFHGGEVSLRGAQT